MIDLQSINKEVTTNMENTQLNLFNNLSEIQIVDGIKLSEGVTFIEEKFQNIVSQKLQDQLGIEFIPNNEFHSTELDLDRDIPDPATFIAVDDLPPVHLREPYDHSIDTIDPDESELPGPSYDSYGYNDEDDVEMVSDCCGEPVHEDHNICSSCNDHCGSEPADLDDFDLEAYCKDNPDFNAAMNGHAEYI